MLVGNGLSDSLLGYTRLDADTSAAVAAVCVCVWVCVCRVYRRKQQLFIISSSSRSIMLPLKLSSPPHQLTETKTVMNAVGNGFFAFQLFVNKDF